MSNEDKTEKKEKILFVIRMTLLIILILALVCIIIYAIMNHMTIYYGELTEEESVYKTISIETTVDFANDYEITYLQDKNGINIIKTDNISKKFVIIDNNIEKPELVTFRCKLGIFTTTQNYLRLTQSDYQILKENSKLITD